jgi:phage-related baseplate assembly protein
MDELDRLLVAGYEQFFGKTVMPGSPERLFISWVEDAIMYERAQNNWTGCQNLPSSAEGEYLDGLAELFYLQERPKPTAATCTMRFYISEPRQTAVLIPAGTRVTDDNAALYWETSADEYVPIGATYTDVQVTCQTVGTAGNDYAVGDIHTAVDIYDYYSGCSNITVSANGSDAPDDEEFYELMRDSQSAWSDAGPIGAYKYFAKRVSTEIADVVANSPSPGTVCLYAVMNDGSVAGEETKRAMVSACSPDEIRPLTDYVISGDPEEVPYDIDLTYYLTRDGSISASEAQSGVNEAVQRYIRWQSGKMGRDINPDRLRYLLLSAGIKRVDLKQPAFTPLEDGAPSLDRNDKVPQVAKLGTVTIKSGGYEDE